MHALLFSLKRTYWSALLRTRQLALIFGITPARFDMLYAIANHSEFGLTQAGLSRILGVSGATVSRMLDSLEELGLVIRIDSRFDRRCNELRLTTEGTERLELVKSALMDSGAMELVVTLIFAFCWTSPSAIQDLLSVDNHFLVVRRNLDDPATLHYPWRAAG